MVAIRFRVGPMSVCFRSRNDLRESNEISV